MSTPYNDEFMPGYHLCFWPRGARLYPSPIPKKNPEELLLQREQIDLTLLASAGEKDQIHQAVKLILLAGYTMAEACRQVGINHQSELLRAIGRIARRIQAIMA